MDTSTRRPGGRTAQVRARVLDATVMVVARDGIVGLRYEAVAELAGVNKTSIYRNWPIREALMSEALLRHGAHTVPLEDSGDLREDLVVFLLALADGLATPVGRAVLVALQSAPDDTALQQAIRDAFEDRIRMVQRRVDAAMQQGDVPAVDGYFLAEMLTGPVHFHVLRGMRPFGRGEAEAITDVVLEGVRTDAQRRLASPGMRSSRVNGRAEALALARDAAEVKSSAVRVSQEPGRE